MGPLHAMTATQPTVLAGNTSDRVIVGTMLVICLLPIWLFTYVPTQDGPSHLHIANVLLKYDDPDLSVLSKFYEINWNFQPNLLVYVVLQPLLAVFPPLIAEKVLLTGFVIGLPLAAAYAARLPHGDGIIAALLGIQILYGYTFHMGFYNYSFGLVFCLLGVGYWRRIVDDLQVRSFAVLGTGILFAYFTHIFSALNLLFIIGLGFLWRVVRYLRAANKDEPWSQRWAGSKDRKWIHLLRPATVHALALVPAATLILMFMLANEGDGSSLSLPSINRLIQLLWMYHLWSFRLDWELPLGLILFLGVLFAVFKIWVDYRKAKPSHIRQPFLMVFLAYVIVFTIIPPEAGSGHFILQRFFPYVMVGLFLWLSARHFEPVFRSRLVCFLIALTLVTIGMRLVQYAALNNRLDEYLAGMESIEPNRTVLTLSLTNERFPSPLLHAGGYIATVRNGVDLKTVQARSPHAPIRYRSEFDPYRQMADDVISNLEVGPPEIDITRYGEKTGGQIDYVLLWGPLDQMQDEPRVQALLRQLNEAYDLIKVSPKLGLMRLYRHMSMPKAGKVGSNRLSK
jgi:hypothetical protein